MAIENIGALWRSTSQNPKAPFASGEITVRGEKIRIVLWNNNKRPDKRDPDYQIALDTPRDGQPEPRRPSAETEAYRERHTDNPKMPPAQGDFTDDIPF